MAKESFQDRYNADAAASKKGRGNSGGSNTSKPSRASKKGSTNNLIWLLLVVLFVGVAWYYNKGKGQVAETKEALTETVQEGAASFKDEISELKGTDKANRSNTNTTGSLPEWANNSDWFYPETPTATEILTKTGFALAYNEAAEQAWWVAYHLTAEELQGTLDRDNFDFDSDVAVNTSSATLKDYKGSGFDRGHLAPAADMKWSAQAMKASFLLSNISPQTHSFNAGIWERLEKRMRGWAKRDGSLYLVTGPVLKEKPSETIGLNQVWVPNSFYKVALAYKKNRWHALAFVIDQQASGKDLQPYFVTIDEVERQTGLDFFAAIPDEEEEALEAASEMGYWFTNSRK